MNKKIITIALCSLLTLGLASCDLINPSSSSSEPQSQVSSEEKQSSENKQSSEDKKSEETSKPSSSSEDSKPESSEPESSEKESSESKPDSSQPESSEPESSEPVSSVPESSEPTPEEPNVLTVYFQNKWNWKDVSAYVWNSTTNTPEVAWPGTPLTKVGVDNEHDMYIVEIDLAQYDYVVFNGFDSGKWNEQTNQNGATNQSPDISLNGVEENTAFYMVWDEENRTNSYGTYTYTPSEDDGGDDTPTDPIPGDPSSSENTSSEPESSEPESSLPESSEPESSLPESSEPGSSEPESSLPESSEPESSEPVVPETYTLYYYNNFGWSKVNAYYWGNASNSWPGTEISLVEGETEWYYVTFTADQVAGLNIIFNNGSGSQTADIKVDLENPYHYGLLGTGFPSKEAVLDEIHSATIPEDKALVFFSISWLNINTIYANSVQLTSTAGTAYASYGQWYAEIDPSETLDVDFKENGTWFHLTTTKDNNPECNISYTIEAGKAYSVSNVNWSHDGSGGHKYFSATVSSVSM